MTMTDFAFKMMNFAAEADRKERATIEMLAAEMV